jgi:hypothetical protein
MTLTVYHFKSARFWAVLTQRTSKLPEKTAQNLHLKFASTLAGNYGGHVNRHTPMLCGP